MIQHGPATKAKTVVKTAAAAGAAAAAAYQITHYRVEHDSKDVPQLQEIAQDILEHLAK